MKTLPTPWDHVVMVVGGETSPSHSPKSLNPGEKLGVILEPVLLNSYLQGNCCVNGSTFTVQKNSITWRCDLVSVTCSMGNQMALREKAQKCLPYDHTEIKPLSK